MSSYIDHREARAGKPGSGVRVIVTHSWKAHAARTLTFLYGDHPARMRSPQSVADITAWYALGSKDAA